MFACLDDIRMDNLTLKASVYHYHKKLWEMTCPFIPEIAPVSHYYLVLLIYFEAYYLLFITQYRYNELYRALKQWRDLQHRMTGGEVYPGVDVTSPGALALFCAACPQPGVNIPKDWKEDPDQLVYTRGLVMDGNFTAIHQKNKKAALEKPLSDGNLFMVASTPYNCYLQLAKEYKQVLLFNEIFSTDVNAYTLGSDLQRTLCCE